MGLTEAFIDTFGRFEQSQAEAIDGLPPARDFGDKVAAGAADDPAAGSESDAEAGSFGRGGLTPPRDGGRRLFQADAS